MDNEPSSEVKAEHHEHKPEHHEHPAEHKIEKIPFNWSSWYDKNYKFLLIIPALLLIASVIFVISFSISTGDIFIKDVTLTGGTALTVFTDKPIMGDLEKALQSKFNDIVVRKLTDVGTEKQIAVTVESPAKPEELKPAVEEFLGYKLDEKNSSTEFTGASLSQSFYKELIFAMLLAFLFMSLVVFLIFKVPLPSVYVIVCAFTDIIVPLSVVDLLGMRISTAGIAAFLMLIGYSVDTDILLTMRVLRRKEELLNARIFGAFKTGITMTLTSLAAVTVGYFITISPVLKEIFFILILGLIADLIVTWSMNATLLKWYCDKKGIQ
jgi:preprotein translocase subunit SecF